VADVDAASRSSVDAGDGLRIRSLPLGDGEWLVVAEPRNQEDEQFVRAVRASVATALGVALAAAAVAWVLVRRTLEPVRRATGSASRIASGELDAPLPVGGAAEIGELAGALARMVEALRAASDAHRDSEHRMREFLGDASHELRTPLTVITGYVDLLAGERPVDESQRTRALSRLRTETSRMDGIIRDLLMLAEMDAVQVSLDEVVDLGELTAEYAGDLMDQQPERPVTLACSAVTVCGSRPHLARLLANLVSNIQRHTEVTASVSVTVVRELSDAVLTIDDAGPGLPVAMYERAATGFERFDRSRSTGAGGFGLGLGMVAAVVRLHGGSLTLSRSPLGGLRTVVRIPAR
jgi:two-component system OmpR family sensor kinase